MKYIFNSLPLTILAFFLPLLLTSFVIHAAETSDNTIIRTVINLRDAREVLFTDQWKFLRGESNKAGELSFDDRAWRTLDLPHDWSIEASFDPRLASCTAFLPCGTGWYRKTFTLPADAKDKCVRIRFDGISNHSTVWCNGEQVGERAYGYSSFTCDLTSAIKFGSENVIAVRVDHRKYADSRWYAGSGIYRNVFLTVSDKVHVATNGTFVTTPKVSEESADVAIETTLQNEGTVAEDVTITTLIKDDNGTTITSTETAGSVPAKGLKQFAAVCKVDRPALWSPDHPSLYNILTQVRKGGELVDEYTTAFGIRTFIFDPDLGFSLNGQSMKLKGVCLHHDAGALGAAVPIEVWERRLKLLKEGGCNAIRCSHNPPAAEFLDLCDRMGFLVMDEAFDEWTGGKKKWIVGHNVGEAVTDGYHSDFDRWADIDIRDMVLRDRNHPSIIMWSIGNEIDYTNDPFPPESSELPPIAERLIRDVKAVDRTRPVTAACAAPGTNLFKRLLDIEGYNYMEQRYPADHAAHPRRVIYGSENSHNATAWEAVVKNDNIAGQFLWTGIDYLGEAGVWPAHASGAGLLNLAGVPKTQYYFRKSLWTDAPMVYLSTSGMPRRRRPATTAAEHSIFCMTNCDEVELFHDGQSLGTKVHSNSQLLTWPVDFTSGVLKAVGKKQSAVVTFELKNAGAAKKLVIKPDLTEFKADGRSLAQIEVDVTDARGTLVPDASNLIACTLTGPGRIVGIENGDIRCTEDYTGTSHRVYQGRMLIYVESSRTQGEITLKLASSNLEPNSVRLESRRISGSDIH